MQHGTLMRTRLVSSPGASLAVALTVSALAAAPALAGKPGGGTSCPRQYMLTALPNLGSVADVNDAGWVLFSTSSTSASICFVDPSGNVSGTTTFQVPGWPNQINNRGWIAGHYEDPPPSFVEHPYLLVPEDSDEDGVADTWIADTNGDGVNDLVTLLPHPGEGRAFSLNDTGTLVGRGAGEPMAWVQQNAAWTWNPIVPSDGGAWVPDVNDRGSAVGQANGGCWLWKLNADGSANVSYELGSLGGGGSEVYAVNDGGDVAGLSRIAGSWLRHAILVRPVDSNGDGEADTWLKDDNQDGANDLMIDVGSIRSTVEAWSVDVNDATQVVGVLDYAVGGGARTTFLWENGTTYDLQKCGPPSSWNLRNVTAINNRGQIVGMARVKVGRSFAILPYLLTPQ